MYRACNRLNVLAARANQKISFIPVAVPTNHLKKVSTTQVRGLSSTLALKSDSTEALASVQNVIDVAEPSLFSQGLGLANFGPTGIVQAFLESIHLGADLPWWGSIVAATVIFRLTLTPLVIVSRRRAVEYSNHTPELNQFMIEVNSTDNPQEKLAILKRRDEYMKANNISDYKHILPSLGNGIFLSLMFFSLRGMTSLPVEAMKTGGIFWFPDLTMTDPFFLLPILTSSSLLLNIHLGAEVADVPMAATIKKVFLVIPILSLPVMCQFPAALNVYWFTSNVITLVQSQVLKVDGVRTFFKIGKQRTGMKVMTPSEMFEESQALKARKAKEKEDGLKR